MHAFTLIGALFRMKNFHRMTLYNYFIKALIELFNYPASGETTRAGELY